MLPLAERPNRVDAVSVIQEFGTPLAAMVVLAAGSAFFSCSEAALFSLQSDDRRTLRHSATTGQIVLDLLGRPERLLTAILFWNLMFNIVYFSLASVVSIQLQRQARHTEAGVVAIVSLLAIILFSEMVPKTVGVLLGTLMAQVVSLPLTLAVRVLDPLAPIFSSFIRALRRVFLPQFRVETYLKLSDLEQAVTVSTADEELAQQERTALQNIVLLSNIRAEELMRPRTQYQTFSPPVHLEDLGGQPTRSGYLFVTEPDSEEIAAAIVLQHMPTVPRHHLEHFAQEVVYVPWCATVAAIFDELQLTEREVAVVINELGETIGIVTLEDLLQTVFEDQASRSVRLLETAPISPAGENCWLVTGMTSLRRLGREFNVELPRTKSATVAGLVQELLQRLPKAGDIVHWEHFEFRVRDADQWGQMTVQLSLQDQGGDT